MEFSFETNGSNTFLVYKIRPEDRLDTMTLGMITNNRILGLAPALYTQMNTERFLKYNVTVFDRCGKQAQAVGDFFQYCSHAVHS